MTTEDETYALIGAAIALLWSHALVWDRAKRQAFAEGQRLAAMRLLAAFKLVRTEDYDPMKPPTVDEAISRVRNRDTSTT